MSQAKCVELNNMKLYAHIYIGQRDQEKFIKKNSFHGG